MLERSSITFSALKRLQIAEVTIQARLLTIAASGEADTLEAALRKALINAENQARRHRDRRIEGKRLPKGRRYLPRLRWLALKPVRPSQSTTPRRRGPCAPAKKPAQ
jgi:hypothetical protein